MRWLIDGHNLIGQMPNLHLDDPHDEAKLLEHLRRFRAKTGHTLTVVFDAGSAYKPGTKLKRGGITVQYAPTGRTADQIIMRRLRKIRNPQGMMVVTSDRAIQTVARQAQVRVTDARDFAQQLTSGGASAGAGAQADVSLSPDEIEEWLRLFGGS